MRLFISDLYIKCDDLIKDANILYNIAINKIYIKMIYYKILYYQNSQWTLQDLSDDMSVPGRREALQEKLLKATSPYETYVLD